MQILPPWAADITSSKQRHERYVGVFGSLFYMFGYLAPTGYLVIKPVLAQHAPTALVMLEPTGWALGVSIVLLMRATLTVDPGLVTIWPWQTKQIVSEFIT